MTTALFAGSFDPFTIGHLDIVERGLRLFDRIVVGIGHNENKPGDWTPAERLAAIKVLFQNQPRVEAAVYTGLTTDFAARCGATALLRSARNEADFGYERNLADVNRNIAGIETVILTARPELAFISSSMVRELTHFGKNPSQYIAGPFQTPQKYRKQ